MSAADVTPPDGERPQGRAGGTRPERAGLPARLGRRASGLAVSGGARYAEFLPDAQAVANREPKPLARVLLLTVALLFTALVAWAALAEVDRVATAPGQVRPAGRVKVINHAEGGRVDEIYVAEGQRVAAGEPLVRFDPAALADEIARQTNDWENLVAEAARLEAEVAGDDEVPFPDTLIASNPALVVTQHDLFEARPRALLTRRELAEKIINQRVSEGAALADRVDMLKGGVEILEEQEHSVRELTETEYFPRLRYLTLLRQLSDLRGDLAQAEDNLAAATAAEAEAREARTQIDLDWFADVHSQLSAVRRERDNLALSLKQLRTRRARLLVRSPVDGVVQNIALTAVGQAVNENEPMMNIVPTADTLIVEARVSNADIGHIGVGQAAEVRVRTYDWIRFGALTGVVEQVAADATQDPETEAFNYIVRVRTDRTYLGKNAGEQPVVPGMEADVDLKIGKRTILSYLTDRVLQTSGTAFRER